MSKQASTMQTRRCYFRLTLMIAIMLVSFAPSLFATEETVKSLVGKWGGTVATKDPFRRLTIESIAREGDQWVGKGRWSDTEAGKGAPVDITIVDITIIDAGESVGLSFQTGAANNVDLKLTDQRELRGKFNHMQGRQRRNADAMLKTVD
jgi:hypothetical protein